VHGIPMVHGRIIVWKVTMLLTHLSTALLENLTVAELVKKHLSLYENLDQIPYLQETATGP
jgi:hypothetical protein